MLQRLKKLFGNESDPVRPYESLTDTEIVVRFAEGRMEIEENTWGGTPRVTIDECLQLMDEWERRGYDPTVLENEAERLEERMSAEKRNP
ncbi:hypothetical protein BRC83_05365 [Halobacteriales archaeon QS_1_68_17]|nr:MAG: hypothetical protein BRC83_05365 [Halobacteriales archaeon QS_1_68_17]